MKGLSVSGTVFNGLVVKDDEGAYKAFPAAGGELQKSAGFKNKNAKDYQLFVNQVLKEDGSGISAYWYRGQIDLPKPGTAADDFSPAHSYGDTFGRWAIYGSWMIMPQVGVQAGYQQGSDHYLANATSVSKGTFKSKGWFAEVDAPINDGLTLGARYEMFDPSDRKDDNDRKRTMLFANVPLNDGFQVITEYFHQAAERHNLSDVKDDNFQVRIIWIW